MEPYGYIGILTGNHVDPLESLQAARENKMGKYEVPSEIPTGFSIIPHLIFSQSYFFPHLIFIAADPRAGWLSGWLAGWLAAMHPKGLPKSTQMLENHWKTLHLTDLWSLERS